MQQYKKILGKVMMTAEGAYNSNKGYDPISLVTDEETGKSYISRQEVPVGTQINNREYWQPIASSGIIDNGVIILNRKNSDGQVPIYDLKSATEAVAIGDRKGGVILGFLGFNPETDTAPTWKLYQYNDVSPSNWTNIDYWLPMDYTNKYAGWFDNEVALYDSVPFPKVGMYAYVGNSVLNAVIYRCYNDRVWQPTEDKAFSGVVNLADEEDITSKQNKLKFKDKEYNPAQYNGMGRIYLRKNIVERINVLTQIMMQATNTIYIIQYDYDLHGETITVPENCTLQFEGGSFSNGTIIGNGTIIKDTLSKIFGLDITIQGTFNVDFARPEWFGAISDGSSDSTDAIQKAFDSFLTIKFSRGHYFITETINCTYCHTFFGSSNQQMYSETAVVLNSPESGNTTAFKLDGKYMPYFSISDICIYGPTSTVEKAVFREGTIGIDSRSGNCVRLDNVRLTGFETLVYSDYNSYYNKIVNCRLENSKYPLRNFSANNLIIKNNRFLTFETGICISGDGTTTISENSFEVFNNEIINFTYNTGSCSFINNYVEVYDSYELYPFYEDRNNGYFGGNYLFYGSIKSFTSIGNEMQVNGAKRIHMFKNIENFISLNNHYIVFENNCNIELYFIQEEANIKIKNFISVDYIEKRTSEDIRYTSTYEGSAFINTDAENSKVILGTDIFNGKDFIPYSGNKVVSPNRYGGWWYNDSSPVFQNRINNGFYFRGKITRRTDFAPVADDLIATIPLLNLNSIHHYTSYFKTMNGDYEDVVLSFNHGTGELRIVSGSKDKDIYLDGIVIYDAY